MKSLLEAGEVPQFLDMRAREMFLQARATAAQSCLLQNPFIQDGPDTIWFTWTGTKIQRTLRGLGEYFGGLSVNDEDVALVFEKAPVAHVQEIYRGFLAECPDAVALAMHFPHRLIEKYDRYLSDDLTALLFARERLDLSGALDKGPRDQSLNGLARFRECEAPAEPLRRVPFGEVAGPGLTQRRLATVAELALSNDQAGQSKFADNASRERSSRRGCEKLSRAPNFCVIASALYGATT